MDREHGTPRGRARSLLKQPASSTAAAALQTALMSIQTITLLDLSVALLLGAAVGFERRLQGHSAGMHTHALIALGAALFVILDQRVSVQSQPSLITSQVVTGVGFLCGGVLMHIGVRIRGLNTAATMWCAAAVGALSGYHELSTAMTGTVLLVISNLALHVIEHDWKLLRQPLKAKEEDEAHAAADAEAKPAPSDDANSNTNGDASGDAHGNERTPQSGDNHDVAPPARPQRKPRRPRPPPPFRTRRHD